MRVRVRKETNTSTPTACMYDHVCAVIYVWLCLTMYGWMGVCMYALRVRPAFQDRSLALFVFALTVSLLTGNEKEGALYPYTRRDRVIVLRPSFLHRRPHETALIDPFKTQANLHVGIS